MGIKGGYHLQLGQGLDETGRESSVVPGPQLSAQHKVIEQSEHREDKTTYKMEIREIMNMRFGWWLGGGEQTEGGPFS